MVEWNDQIFDWRLTCLVLGLNQRIDGMTIQIFGLRFDCDDQKINFKQIYVVFYKVVIFMEFSFQSVYGYSVCVIFQLRLFTKLFR